MKADKKFHVIPGGAVATKGHSKKLRERVRDAAERVNTDYVDLALLLVEVWDTPSEDNNSLPIYTSWGYATFHDYAEQELGLARRKAEHLRHIGVCLQGDLAALDSSLRSRLLKLGWSKVRELVRVLTVKNAKKWLDMAEALNYQELLLTVQAFKKKQEAAEIEAEQGGDKTALPSPSTVYAEVASSGKPKNVFAKPKFQAPPEDASETLDDSDDGPPTIPAVPKLFRKDFSLYAEQAEVVNMALERASQLAESDKPSHLLTLICIDFLATQDLKPDEEQKLRWLARIEHATGLRLVAFDAAYEFVYGLNTLEKIQKNVVAMHGKEEDQ